MDVTILICTWNRAEKLRNCLTSLLQLEVPAGLEWEIVVVNNCCTDHTSSVIQSFHDSLPIREVFEPQLGHSVSRNTGISMSSGTLILFTDDDVQVDPKWISEIKRVSDQYPKSCIFGGPIYPQLEKVPRHIQKCMESPFFDGLILRKNLGSGVKILDESESLFGANMAFRRTLFEQIRFDSCLGLKGNDHIRGDETDLIERARQKGATVVWVPSAQVSHEISINRLSYRFSLYYFWGAGRTHMRARWIQHHNSEPLLFPEIRPINSFSLLAQWAFIGGQIFESVALSCAPVRASEKKTLQI